MRISILKEGFDQPLSDLRLSALVAKAAKSLESLGCVVEEVSVPMHKLGPTLWTAPGRMSGHSSLVAQNCGRRVLHLNDLTDKVLPLTQEKFDAMFAGSSNAVVAGKWAWDHLPPALLGKAMNLIRKLRDDYYKALTRTMCLSCPQCPCWRRSCHRRMPALPSSCKTPMAFP
jgi:amidase